VAIRVVVAEDSFIVHEGLRSTPAASPNLDVVAAHGDLKGPHIAGLSQKRLMGFEPTTFCMASTC
jgi:hypothetical protein